MQAIRAARTVGQIEALPVTARAYDVAGEPRSLSVRPATEDWYCIATEVSDEGDQCQQSISLGVRMRIPWSA